MKLRELLNILKQTQQEFETSEALICGGTVRDKYQSNINGSKLDGIADLDLCTGDKTIDLLSEEYYNKLAKQFNIERKVMADGHSTIFIGNLKMDFSSNFNIPNIDHYLKYLKVESTSLNKEVFSRDFTCNALLMNLDLTKIMDPTQRGFKDIKDKKIRTCLSPKITLTSNKNRVVRAIYLACKLDFDIDQSIIDYVKANPLTIKISTPKSLSEKLNQAFAKDGDRASDLITKMGLWNQVPILESMYQYYQKHLEK
jgi:tRNA nucleotidyltransferase/poly(A) polymerase